MIEPPPEPPRAGPPPARALWPAAMIGLAVLSPLCFALVTHQAWEDFFITFRHSANLVQGHGLTYQPGERIQGFSSPFATLLGALAFAASGGGSSDDLEHSGALWILRLLGAAACGLAAWFLHRCLADSPRAAGGFAASLALALFALEPKSAAFTANGMETPFFVLCLAGALWATGSGAGVRPVAAGCFFAGLLWTRPDGCVYIACLGLACLLFPRRAAGARLRALLRASGICALLYLPWVLFAWAYYGNPVPQTVVAKGIGYAGRQGLAGLAGMAREIPALFYLTVLPPYAQKGGWEPFVLPGALLAMAGALMWLVPGTGVIARRGSFAAAGALLYLGLVGLNSPWYFPPVFALMIPAFGEAFERLGGRRPDGRVARRALAAALALALAGPFAYLWADYARLARVTTALSEQRGRRTLGLWLRANAGRDDRVFLECPGIIGYYSGLKMLDYPGLVSPEVTAVSRRLGRGMARAGLALAPEWMVLRPHEFRLFKTIGEEEFRRAYSIARVFDQRPALESSLPGRRSILYDGTFIVLGRRDRWPATAPDAAGAEADGAQADGADAGPDD